MAYPRKAALVLRGLRLARMARLAKLIRMPLLPGAAILFFLGVSYDSNVFLEFSFFKIWIVFKGGGVSDDSYGFLVFSLFFCF